MTIKNRYIFSQISDKVLKSPKADIYSCNAPVLSTRSSLTTNNSCVANIKETIKPTVVASGRAAYLWKRVDHGLLKQDALHAPSPEDSRRQIARFVFIT